MKKILIVGYGGHAKSIADSIVRGGEYQIVGYTDLKKQKSEFEYLGTDDRLQAIYESGVHNAVVGVGYLGKGDLRQQMYKRLKEIGFDLPVIADPSAIVSSTAKVGEGTFIGKNAIVNTETSVGKMVIINTMALVEHECVIEDYSHIAVAAVLCGQVKVGEAAFIGANSTVIQCREIEAYSIVPAGVTVR